MLLTFGLALSLRVTDRVEGPRGEGSVTSDLLQVEKRTKLKTKEKTINNLMFDFIFLFLFFGDIVCKEYGDIASGFYRTICQVMTIKVNPGCDFNNAFSAPVSEIQKR